VLTYHRVATPTFDPFALACAPEWFAGHVAVLRRRAAIVPLAEMLEPTGRGRRPEVAITFDDGYRDTLEVAVPILRAEDAPATVFVPTGYLGDVRGYWWDRVAAAIGASDVEAAALTDLVGAMPVPPEHSLADPDTAVAVAGAVATRVRAEPPDERDDLVAAVEARLPERPGVRREAHPVLDEAGVRALAATPGITIGGHTDRHPVLAGLAGAEQESEIVRGLDRLEGLTGRRPQLLAYPYGAAGDYDDASCGAAASAGVRAAFVNHHRRFDGAGDRFRIPRWAVPAQAPDAFGAWLDRALAA
jgi:peptidoglycan/xylan/chitin deacetylase (PgdA/CDA1 family)